MEIVDFRSKTYQVTYKIKYIKREPIRTDILTVEVDADSPDDAVILGQDKLKITHVPGCNHVEISIAGAEPI